MPRYVAHPRLLSPHHVTRRNNSEEGISMEVQTELNPQFSSPDASPTPWAAALAQIDDATTYWLVSVRPDGRPHATTVAGVVLDGRFHFVTGSDERKARNLAAGNRHVIIITGRSEWEGLDIVVEGEAVRITETPRLREIVDAFTRKYHDFFGMRLVEGRIQSAGSPGEPLAFVVQPRQGFGFGKGDMFSQTRWRFRE
jgi:hypothetical protein